MAVKFKSFAAQYNAPIRITGTLPIDARTVVSTLEDLYGPKSQSDNTWEYAYNGLIVAVESEQSVYVCINDALPYEAASWKKLGDDIYWAEDEIEPVGNDAISNLPVD